MPADTNPVSTLKGVTTATLTNVLLKRGLRNVFLRGAAPLLQGQGRIAGPAFTFRFVPGREDLGAPPGAGTTRDAIEAMPQGAVAVAGGEGILDAGLFGDILCGRMAARGVAGLVTDGALRDRAGIIETGLPAWCAAVAAPGPVGRLAFVGWQQPIGCGGVAILPGDILVADADGAVVIPQALAAEVAAEALEQERFEGWVADEVAAGAVLPGLYPPDAAALARYAAAKALPD